MLKPFSNFSWDCDHEIRCIKEIRGKNKSMHERSEIYMSANLSPVIHVLTKFPYRIASSYYFRLRGGNYEYFTCTFTWKIQYLCCR